VVSIEKPLACSTEMHQKVLLGFPVAIIIEGIAYNNYTRFLENGCRQVLHVYIGSYI
jgi:hypothetical protein